MVCLDGSTLEGGGQLVRNAVTLSALTSQPVKISKIRFKREGSRGLRSSHTAAIQCLLDICGGTAENVRVGSSEIIFYPQGQKKDAGLDKQNSSEVNGLAAPSRSLKLDSTADVLPVQSEYNVRLKTPGSVFLIFQALYPYLLYASSCANARAAATGETPMEGIKLRIAGGTNVSYAPSYDYISQVLVPNFAKLGLPQLDVELKHRGWSSGQTNIGSVAFFIKPLDLCKAEGTLTGPHSDPERILVPYTPMFPKISLHKFARGNITQIDITVLAPDISFDEVSSARSSKKGKERNMIKTTLQADETSDQGEFVESEHETTLNSPWLAKRGAPNSIREFVENYALEAVSRAFSPKAKRVFNIQPPKIELHSSEKTSHYSQVSILLVAHTSTGFRLGRDLLYGAQTAAEKQTVQNRMLQKQRGKGKGKGNKRSNSKLKTGDELQRTIEDMTERCVEDLMYELADGENERDLEKLLRDSSSKRFLDSFMRDQVVVFQALGKLNSVEKGEDDAPSLHEERDLSLHTQTAMWVCEQMLRVRV